MATVEQLEAWSVEAANQLSEKIGSGAQVIIMVADMENPKAAYMIERRGHTIGLTWLLQVGRRILENMLLPTPTISRQSSD